MTIDMMERGFTPEKRPESVRLKIRQTERASFGVYEDYPEELLDKLADHPELLLEGRRENRGGHRMSFPVTVELHGGRDMKLYAKSKFHELREEGFLYGAVEQHEVYKHSKQYYKDHPEPAGAMDKKLDHQRLVDSVVNELAINRLAARLYKERFGQDLPMEKAVGFCVDRRGRKWALFELIENIIDLQELDDAARAMLENKAWDYCKAVHKKLAEIGISADDMESPGMHSLDPHSNVVFVGDKSRPEEAKMVIIDSEGWRDERDK